MKLRPIAAITLRQLYLWRSSPTRLLAVVAWVAIDIIVWGFMSTYLNTVAVRGMNFVGTLLGAVLLWDLFTRVMQGVTMGFFEDVWARNFINVFATPLRISEYLAGLVVTSLITSVLALAVMLALSVGLFGLQFLHLGLLVAPFLLVVLLFGMSLGIFAIAAVLRLGPASEWLIWPVPALLSPFVGVYYPLSTLPAWMQSVGHALPPSYAFENMRSLVLGHGYSAAGLAIGVGLSLVYLAAACFTFAAIYRRTVRMGLLARYTAEGAG